MLSKAQIKYIRSLTHQKSRKEHNAFIAEGDKIALEWLTAPGEIQIIVAVKEWASVNQHMIACHPEASLHIVDDIALQAVSALQTPNQALLVVPLPEYILPERMTEWCIVLDGVQDPGNVGTIIRIADWFGIKHVVSSPESADFYNPKVVQAAMGSHLRVQLHKTDPVSFLSSADIPILAGALDGENIYTIPKPATAILIIGNESRGISGAISELSTQKIKIPQKGGAESLNAAVSAGIICALLAGS